MADKFINEYFRIDFRNRIYLLNLLKLQKKP